MLAKRADTEAAIAAVELGTESVDDGSSLVVVVVVVVVVLLEVVAVIGRVVAATFFGGGVGGAFLTGIIGGLVAIAGLKGSVGEESSGFPAVGTEVGSATGEDAVGGKVEAGVKFAIELTLTGTGGARLTGEIVVAGVTGVAGVAGVTEVVGLTEVVEAAAVLSGIGTTVVVVVVAGAAVDVDVDVDVDVVSKGAGVLDIFLAEIAGFVTGGLGLVSGFSTARLSNEEAADIVGETIEVDSELLEAS